MKILSNFDTKLYDDLRAQYIQTYGSRNVMVIRRASIFFRLYIMVPLVGLILLQVVLVWLAFGMSTSDSALSALVQITSLIIAVSMLGYRGYHIIKRFLDYTMDFCIITPKELVSYNQAGLFNRHTEVIDTEKIKTINKIPQGLFGSLFDFGTIIFLSEGDKDIGDISLNFVEQPEATYKQVRTIIEPHLNEQAGEQVFVKSKQLTA